MPLGDRLERRAASASKFARKIQVVSKKEEETVVEAAGVEPASENARREKTTCVSDS